MKRNNHRKQLLAGALALLLGNLMPLQAQPVPIWSDEFDVEGQPDSSKWHYDVGGHGWGNNELQFYTEARAANARVEGGVLIIEAHKEHWVNEVDFVESNDYTSARLISKGLGDWLYGRVEIRAKLPAGRGTWPAIWMLSSGNPFVGWPYSGEIDIMEHVGYDMGRISSSLHFTDRHGSNALSGATMAEDVDTTFHVYAMEWDPDEIRFFMDGVQHHSYLNPQTGPEAWPFFGYPFYLILNIAVGGDWGGQKGIDPNIWPQRMEVDYVRVYDVGSTQTLDSDVDMIPNASDPDDDNDGLNDVDEHKIGTNIYLADTDGDGYNDMVEVEAGSSPLSEFSTPDNAGQLFSNADFLLGHQHWNVTVRRVSCLSGNVSFLHSWTFPEMLDNSISIGPEQRVTFASYNRIGICSSDSLVYQMFNLGRFNSMGLKRGDAIIFTGVASAETSSDTVNAEARIQFLKSETETNTDMSRHVTIGSEETKFKVQVELEPGDVGTILIGLGIETSEEESGTITFHSLEARVNHEGLWGDREIYSGHCDTGNWMGWLNVEMEPWAYCLKTQCWFYIPEPVAEIGTGWIYIPDTAPLLLELMPGTDWGWSWGLSKWMYLNPGGSGWVYLVG
ncbi:MAG: family 16 glycosylhydrolase [Puniceicoccaceae bacterium]